MYGRNYGNGNANALAQTISGDYTFTGDNVFTGLNNFITGDMILPDGIPINAEEAKVIFAIASRPPNYIRKVKATGNYAIAGVGTEDKVVVIDGTTLTYKAGANYTDATIHILVGTDAATQITELNKTIGLNPTIAGKVTSVDNQTLGRVDLTSILYGSAYNYTITSDDANTTPSAATMTNGAVEVRNTYLINGKQHTFAESGGHISATHLAADYPADLQVLTAAAATVADVITAWLIVLKAETTTFSASSVTSTATTIIAKYKTRGIVGNAISCVDSCAGISDNLGVPDLFLGGIDGTPGYENQILLDGDTLYKCTATDFTITNNNWVSSFTVNGLTNTGYVKNSVRELTDNDTVLVTDSNLIFTITTAKTCITPIPVASEFDEHYIEIVNHTTSTAILTVGSLCYLLPGDVATIRYKTGAGWSLRKKIPYMTYVSLSKSHSQTNLTANTHHIEWNTLTGDANSLITVSAGTNQTAGIISIPPGVWHFTGLNDYINNGTYLSWEWENSDTYAVLSPFASLLSPTFPSSGNQTQLDWMITNNTATFMNVDLYIIGNGSVTSMRAADSTLTIIRMR
jgi:hypothetical protein